MTYDSNNIFAKILRGEIPCHKIYEDEHTLAFMDVMPQVEGHCLVVPKAPSRGLLDAEPQRAGPCDGDSAESCGGGGESNGR